MYNKNNGRGLLLFFVKKKANKNDSKRWKNEINRCSRYKSTFNLNTIQYKELKGILNFWRI